jgi:acyl carrier protein
VSVTDAPLPWRSEDPAAAAVLDELRGMLRRILGEFGFSAEDAAAVTMDTTFYGDLEMESIDLVALAGQLAQRYGDAVNFAEFLAAFDLDQVIDLRVGQLVGHIVAARRRADLAAGAGLVAGTGAR